MEVRPLRESTDQPPVVECPEARSQTRAQGEARGVDQKEGAELAVPSAAVASDHIRGVDAELRLPDAGLKALLPDGGTPVEVRPVEDHPRRSERLDPQGRAGFEQRRRQRRTTSRLVEARQLAPGGVPIPDGRPRAQLLFHQLGSRLQVHVQSRVVGFTLRRLRHQIEVQPRHHIGDVVQALPHAGGLPVDQTRDAAPHRQDVLRLEASVNRDPRQRRMLRQRARGCQQGIGPASDLGLQPARTIPELGKVALERSLGVTLRDRTQILLAQPLRSRFTAVNPTQRVQHVAPRGALGVERRRAHDASVGVLGVPDRNDLGRLDPGLSPRRQRSYFAGHGRHPPVVAHARRTVHRHDLVHRRGHTEGVSRSPSAARIDSGILMRCPPTRPMPPPALSACRCLPTTR